MALVSALKKVRSPNGLSANGGRFRDLDQDVGKGWVDRFEKLREAESRRRLDFPGGADSGEIGAMNRRRILPVSCFTRKENCLPDIRGQIGTEFGGGSHWEIRVGTVGKGVRCPACDLIPNRAWYSRPVYPAQRLHGTGDDLIIRPLFNLATKIRGIKSHENWRPYLARETDPLGPSAGAGGAADAGSVAGGV